jgi:hypothetical protein
MGRSGIEAVACSLLAAVAWLAASPARGQGTVSPAPVSPGPRGQVAASLTVGVSRPADTVFRDVYGSAVVPVTGQVDWRLGPLGFGLFGGARWVSAAGEAVAEGTSQPGGERVQFSMLSWRLGPSWGGRRGPWGVTAGAGLAYHLYREEWAAAGVRVEDSGIGGVLQGTVERALTRKLAALLRAEYGWFEAEAAEGTGLDPVGLGGFDVAGGLAFRF